MRQLFASQIRATVNESTNVNWLLIANILCKILRPECDSEFAIIIRKRKKKEVCFVYLFVCVDELEY